MTVNNEFGSLIRTNSKYSDRFNCLDGQLHDSKEISFSNRNKTRNE